MQKSASFITQTQLTQNQYKKQTISQYFQDNNEISFDRLLEKSDDEHANPCMDSIFNEIKIKQQTILKQIQNKQYTLNNKKPKNASGVSNLIQQIGEMRQNSKLKLQNKKLQLQLTKIKDKYQKILKDKENNLKQQIKQTNTQKKNNQQLKNKLKNYEKQIKIQKQKNIKLTQTLKEKQNIFNIQKTKLKHQLQNQIQQRSRNSQKNSNTQKIVRELREKIQIIEKNLRIKQKQNKKLEYLQQQRNKFYETTFQEKQQLINKLKQQLNKKNQETLRITQQQVESSEKLKKQFLLQLQQKNSIIEEFSNEINRIMSIVQEHLSQQKEKRNTFQEIQLTNKLLSKKGKDKLVVQTQKLQKMVIKMIQLYKISKKQSQMQIKNFQQIYTKQFDDLDTKMGYLAEQNKQLKYYQQNLRITNQQLHRSLNKSRRNEQQILSARKFKLEQQKLRQNIKIVKKQRLLSKQNEYQKFMNSTGKLNYSKIREQIFENEAIKIQEQIQSTRKLFEQISHKKISRDTLKTRNRQNSQPILRKRSRTSLSWKKPASILQQYV